MPICDLQRRGGRRTSKIVSLYVLLILLKERPEFEKSDPIQTSVFVIRFSVVFDTKSLHSL